MEMTCVKCGQVYMVTYTHDSDKPIDIKAVEAKENP
jgi:hypothetical protein